MEATSKVSRPAEVWVAVAIVVPFLAWTGARVLFRDLWYDEIWSLRYYALAPLDTVLTDYSTPNNHVLYNLINNVLLRLLGIADLEAVLRAPAVIRIPALVYALGALGYVFATARRFLGVPAAWLALALLATSVPFFHFAAQARGYSLSCLLVAALVHHALRYQATHSRWHGGAVVACTGLALWTIPSNLYVVAALAVVLGMRAMAEERNAARACRVPGLIAGGLVLAVVLYSPMLERVLDNPFVRSEGPFRWVTLRVQAPRIFDQMLSARWLLLPLVLIGLARARRRRGAGVFLLVLCLPFLFSFVRGDRPFGRTFVALTPIFTLVLTVALFAELARWRARRRVAAVLTVALYCNVTFALELRGIDRRLARDRELGRMSQDLYCGYYLGDYRPRWVAAELARRRTTEPVLLDGGDRAAMPAYLALSGIDHRAIGALAGALRDSKSCWILTPRPRQLSRELADRFPGIAVRAWNRRPAVHAVLRVAVGSQ